VLPVLNIVTNRSSWTSPPCLSTIVYIFDL